MPRDLILGTAGHIDHGKTSLIRALTGIDCDRLPEEQARGITIDIGFAFLELGGFRLGIVDVPGHERFIKNMLAGASGIDLALLVVAADDGIMPQTREHVEILRFLNLSAGVIALTKSDTVSLDRRNQVEQAIRDLVQGTFLQNASIISTSAKTGEGLDELCKAIISACDSLPMPTPQALFRLPIDRGFVVQGHGTVVTGSAASGVAHSGEELEIQPIGKKVRVRGLQNHGQSISEITRGQRAAINLTGVSLEEIHRGQELATPGWLEASRCLAVQLFVSQLSTRPLKHRSPVRVYLGTAEIHGKLSLLDNDSVMPGEESLAQIFLDQPAATIWQQPFVIRNSSAELTLGGGCVLQPVSRKIQRHDQGSIRYLHELKGHRPIDRARAAAWFQGNRSVQPLAWPQIIGSAPEESCKLLSELVADGSLVELKSADRTIVFHSEVLSSITQSILKHLAEKHRQAPLATSFDRGRIQAELHYLLNPAMISMVFDHLLARKLISGNAKQVAHPNFRPKLSVAQQKLKETIAARFFSANFQPPALEDFVNQAGGNAGSLREILEIAVAEGVLVPISDSVYLHAEHERRLRSLTQTRLAIGEGLTVSEIRDLLGTTRKFAVPICEYLDRVGVTRRDGDLRFAANRERE